MTEQSLLHVLATLIKLPAETEWVEFKHNNADPVGIGEYISALSNSAVLHGKQRAWLIWGIRDEDHAIVGTTFRPQQVKVGNQELEGWLSIKVFPRVDFRFHNVEYAPGIHVVLLEIVPCWHTPVRFDATEFIRVGSAKRNLKDYPEKERRLWELFRRIPFEKATCLEGITSQKVLDIIDYPGMFELLSIPLPDGRISILEKLTQERVVTKQGEDRYNITNLGGILFAKRLDAIESLARKDIRIIIYKGKNRVNTLREQIGIKGYASAFEGIIRYINEQLPSNEVLGEAFRKEFRMYPEVAIRELVANALIHQDFSVTGDGPKVEIFTDRVEFTNPGLPLIETLRFVDEPPQSRNEILAALMRRMNICEERGSGIDKTLAAIELHELPAPEFRTTERHTVATLFSAVPLDKMEKRDRIRACYLHACLKQVSNEEMSNETLRKRLNIPDAEYPKASRIIRDTISEGLVKPSDAASKSRKHARYLPYWA
ncbi:MAG: ATP-binding protein [Candidatus Methylacidiphilales bacterium]|nr:ATP-binding protein [Candidatus Methylacidiphilales bacterium]